MEDDAPNSAAPAPTPGRRLGRYWLMAKLGQGGMADVYLATARGLSGFNKLTVLKVLRPYLSGDPHFLEMFLDEARLAARLNHPNVVQTHEVGSTEGAHFLAMEYLDGQPLYRIGAKLRAAKKIELPHNLRILCDALAGLHYAHELADYDGTALSVVHRDVSPHNLFVTYAGQVKVLDFGIAKALTSVAETSPGVLKGKVTYMAPEQAWGEHVDRRADVFAVGVMLWEALTGRRLWRESEGNIMQRLVNGKIPPPSSVAPWVLERLETITMKALALDKEQRYPTAAAMRTDLMGALEEIGRPDEDALPRLMGELFAEERVTIRTVIDEQLRRVDQVEPEGAMASLPSLDPPTVGSASGASAAGVDRHGVKTDSSVSAAPEPTRSTKIESRSVTLSARPGPPPAGRGRRLVAVALLGGVLAVGATFAVMRPSTGGGLSTGAPAGPSHAAAAVTPSARRVSVQVVASPPDARVLLDGTPLPSNPYLGSVLADGAEHELRAEADGYVASTRRVTFGSDVSAVLRLEKNTAAATPAPSGGAPGGGGVGRRRGGGQGVTAPVGSTPAPTPTTAPAPSGALDWKDPWGNPR